jgi:hypothetical protein
MIWSGALFRRVKALLELAQEQLEQREATPPLAISSPALTYFASRAACAIRAATVFGFDT